MPMPMPENSPWEFALEATMTGEPASQQSWGTVAGTVLETRDRNHDRSQRLYGFQVRDEWDYRVQTRKVRTMLVVLPW
jgi:hypothetical protein